MIHIDVPHAESFDLAHLICDLNGTLAMDGAVPEGVIARLRTLADRLTLHVVTSDTYGSAAALIEQLGSVARLQRVQTGDEKAAYAQALGAERVAAIGNGANDAPLFRVARLAIAVMGGEGLATAALRSATVVVPTAEAALDLLRYPQRLAATLRP